MRCGVHLSFHAGMSLLSVCLAVLPKRFLSSAYISPTVVVRRWKTTHNRGRALWAIDELGRRLRTEVPAPLDNDEGTNERKSSSSKGSGGWDDFDPLQETPASYAPSKRSSRPPRERSSWDEEDTTSERRNNNSRGSSGWDDFDAPQESSSSYRPSRSPRDSSRAPPSRRDGRSKDERPRYPSRDNRYPPRDNTNTYSNRSKGSSFSAADSNEKDARRINMRALEGAGFVHLYGLAPVLNALQANRRDFTNPEALIDLEELKGTDEYDKELAQRARKPEAQFRPYLLVQESSSTTTSRSRDKQSQAAAVVALAEQRGVPVAYVDKGVLNTLSGDRPHQGYVLRCGPLHWESLSRIPVDDPLAPRLWLVLDEVVDPQNLGALVRSAYFFGGATRVGVLVCAKNSAPSSPIVSAASAGALEVLPILTTSNLPRTLAAAALDGCRIVGASLSVPSSSNNIPLYSLVDCPPRDPARMTLLVLGSEGHGLRSLVVQACTELVRIPGAEEGAVDSLNVSVSGGILLWHFMRGTAVAQSE
jgi:21S rRNA (GM2251-2'-O)-methyltransferase